MDTGKDPGNLFCIRPVTGRPANLYEFVWAGKRLHIPADELENFAVWAVAQLGIPLEQFGRRVESLRGTNQEQ
jgi:hypothetical protein